MRRSVETQYILGYGLFNDRMLCKGSVSLKSPSYTEMNLREVLTKKGHLMTVEIAQEETLKFWHGTHPLTAELARLEEKFIPEEGPSPYRETEMLRAAARLYYDYGNNGLCNNMTAEAKYLMLVANEVLGKKLCISLESVRKKILKWTNFDGPTIERQLDLVLERVIQHVIQTEKTGAFTENRVTMQALREERR